MRARLIGVAALCLSLLAGAVTDAQAGRRVRTFGAKEAPKADAAPRPDGGKAEKPFAELTKNKVAVEGLFTFYKDTTDDTWLMAIKPSQFGPIYLLGQTRSAAEGAFFDNGSMGESFPFYFAKVGKTVQMMEKNLRLQADTASPSYRAVQHGISDGLWASTTVKSLPNDSGTILVDPADLFVQDAQNLSYFLGQAAQMGLRFDQKNSYFTQVKSFPQNTEIDVRLHVEQIKHRDEHLTVLAGHANPRLNLGPTCQLAHYWRQFDGLWPSSQNGQHPHHGTIPLATRQRKQRRYRYRRRCPAIAHRHSPHHFHPCERAAACQSLAHTR